VGVARFSMRGKEHLSTLRFQEESLLLETMFWPDEIREIPAPEDHEEAEIRPEEVEMAKLLIETMSGPFVGDDYKDKTRENIEEAARLKVEGKEVVSVDAATEPGEVVDLLAALKASVEATRMAAEGHDPSPAQRAVS